MLSTILIINYIYENRFHVEILPSTHHVVIVINKVIYLAWMPAITTKCRYLFSGVFLKGSLIYYLEG